MAQNIPDYRADLDREYNITWANRPQWSEVTPNEVRVFYADIPQHLKAHFTHFTSDVEYYLPEFAKVPNRFFWVEDLSILHKSEEIARRYKRRINKLKNYLNRFDVPIHSDLKGVPLTSHATLKVFKPNTPQDYVFLKLYASESGHFVSDFLADMQGIGSRLAFYPEVSYKSLGFSNLKRPKQNKRIFMPPQVLRSPEIASKEDFSKDLAIPLHSVLSNKDLLEKLTKASELKSVHDWYRQVYVLNLALLFLESYAVFGVLPGAHTQNIVAIIDKKSYELKEFVWRDLQDLTYNPIIGKSTLGMSIVSDVISQINRSGSEGVPLFHIPYLGSVGLQSISTRTFAEYFGELMGQAFRVKLEPGSSFHERHQLVVDFFEIILNAKYGKDIARPIIESMQSKMNSKPDIIEFAKAAGGIFNDFFTQYQTRNFPINSYTTNYTRQSLVKAFVKSLEAKMVGFYDNYPEQWIRWQKRNQYHKVAKAIETNSQYQLVSNGETFLMLKDLSTGKWMAMSFKKHQPVPFDYLKHQKLLKIQLGFEYFRKNNFNCKAMFY